MGTLCIYNFRSSTYDACLGLGRAFWTDQARVMLGHAFWTDQPRMMLVLSLIMPFGLVKLVRCSLS
uniref:Uncharacterized protein n=1 Tax=Solanum tuberosum TaxID=4113 RepID=M1BKY4_SOLTU